MTPENTNRNPRQRRWYGYVGALLLTALLVAGFWPKPIPVEVAPVTEGPLQSTISEEGRTRVRERFVVAAPVHGRLQRIPFKAGARVEAGRTPIAVIESLAPELLDARARQATEARRDEAKALLDKALAAGSFGASELKRIRKLYEERTVSLEVLEEVEWRAEAALEDIEAARAALRQVEAELAEFDRVGEKTDSPSSVVVRAPVSGQILRVFQESARVVTAGTPLVEIGDPTDIEVVIEVLSRDGAAVQPGSAVLLEHWGGEEPLSARVRLVEPSAFTKISALGVEEQRVNVIADILTPVEERPGLGDQFRVEARIVVWEANQVVKVPLGALFRRGDRWAVFVVDSGRAQLRTVSVGRSSDDEAQVLEGLKPSEEVVLYPSDRVADGRRIEKISV